MDKKDIVLTSNQLQERLNAQKEQYQKLFSRYEELKNRFDNCEADNKEELKALLTEITSLREQTTIMGREIRETGALIESLRKLDEAQTSFSAKAIMVNDLTPYPVLVFKYFMINVPCRLSFILGIIILLFGSFKIALLQFLNTLCMTLAGTESMSVMAYSSDPNRAADVKYHKIRRIIALAAQIVLLVLAISLIIKKSY